MNTYHYQTKKDRSYFEWGDNMQIIRKGKGKIAMTESELVDFFGVTWRKLNHRLQLLLKVSPLQPDERDTGEQEVYVKDDCEIMLRFIHSQSSSPCLINWTVRKHTSSGNMYVRDCRNLHP